MDVVDIVDKDYKLTLTDAEERMVYAWSELLEISFDEALQRILNSGFLGLCHLVDERT